MHNVDVKLEDLGKILGNNQDRDEENGIDSKTGSDNDDEFGDGVANPRRNRRPVNEENNDAMDDIVDTPAFIESLGTESYITFAEFAKVMSMFNPRTGIDEKIQFYFRIFDVDKDKKIGRSDLKEIMKMLFGSKLSQEDMETLGNKIFAEVVQSSEKDFLDQDDVQKILWSTNIEHKCSMHFF